jgi:FtsH-binding integral membrane protein
MITIFIVGIVILIIALCALLSEKNELAFALAMLGSWLTSGALMYNEIKKKPSAMDVYQGKTTLEITYKDGIAVDSIVVFKNKK